MKALVFLLVLVNVLFYAWTTGLFGRPDNPDAGRLAQQVAPERLRIVSSGEAPAPADPADVPAALPAAPASPVDAADAADKLCLVWENLGALDAEKLGVLLTDRFVDFHVERSKLAREANGWWVFIPPLAGKPEAEKKVGELRQLGVSDFFIVQEAANRHAISLGIFSTEKGGLDRLAELKAKGVRSARLLPRHAGEPNVSLQVSGPLAGKTQLLAETAAVLPKFKAKACP